MKPQSPAPAASVLSGISPTMVHSLFSMTSHQPAQGQTQQHAGVGAHEEHLVSALHAALNNLSTSETQHESPGYSPGHAISPKEKAQTSLDIQVAKDTLILRGTGVDVEPTLLSGNVVLILSEPTTIRQITLMFRGKARVPTNPTDPYVLFPWCTAHPPSFILLTCGAYMLTC